MYISNDLSSTIPKKNIYNNDNMIKKTVFNSSKINTQKVRKNKNRNKNRVHSAKIIYRKAEKKNSEKINPLIIIKLNSKNNNLNNLNIHKKGKKCNLSFEKEKNPKDQQNQIGFRKTFNKKKTIKELILINSKTFKKE